jgi:hypothetical protein
VEEPVFLPKWGCTLTLLQAATYLRGGVRHCLAASCSRFIVSEAGNIRLCCSLT